MSEIKVDKELIVNTIMNNSQDTIYIKDKNSAIILSSKAHSQLWGVDDPAEVVGKTDFDYFPYEFAKIAYEEEQRLVRGEVTIITREEKLVKPSGEIQWLLSSKYPFYDAEGGIVGTWGSTKDITAQKEAAEKLEILNRELKEANRKLSILSTKDSLSGLYNHGYFLERLAEEFDYYESKKNQGETSDFSLIMLDIDDFKIVNDTCGHLIGDTTIRKLSNIIKKNIDSPDNLSFRCGGDEFAILLLDTEPEKAWQIAETLHQCIGDTPIKCRGHSLRITVSVGVAAFSECVDDQELIRIADERLYISKNTGKNKIN